MKRKTWRSGDPLDHSHYLRLRRKASQCGGFAYVFASNDVINLRLRHNKEIERVAPDAFALTAGHPQYRVNIQIRDEATLKQAVAPAPLSSRAADERRTENTPPGEPDFGERFTSHSGRRPAARYGQQTRPRATTASTSQRFIFVGPCP
jgi:hypothetical protein